MKKLLVLLVVAVSFLLSGAPAAYRMLKIGNFRNGQLIDSARDKFTFKMKSSGKAKYLVAVTDVKLDINAQKKLMFRFCGAPNLGAGAHLTVAIAYTSAGDRKWKNALSPSLKISNKEFKSCTLGFDTEFRLPDSTYTLRQIKFVINSAGLPDGTDMVVKVDSIRVGDAAEGSAGELTVVPPPIPQPVTTGTRKIFFELENDDDSDAVFSRFNPKWIKSGEPVPPAGFAELILKGTEGIFSETKDISKADVIIYSRITPGKNGKAVFDAVKAGRTLICAGTVPDKELASLLALEVRNLPNTGLPERRKIYSKSNFKVENFNDCHYPLTVSAVFLPGAKSLLSFTDGTAFLAQKGNVFHFANSIGASVEKSDVFFDRLLLKLASDSATRKKLAAREREIIGKLRKQEKSAVGRAVKSLNISPDNWRVGASQENFGRFGWRIGVAMSSGTLNNDLSFSSGDQSFKLSNFSGEAIALDKWTLSPLDKAVKIPRGAGVLSSWGGFGKVKYTAQTVIPASWKDLDITFEVSSGIDDVDEFSVNGRVAGKTTTSTPEYWMTPRKYSIDKRLIKFGQVNRFQLIVQNLNGNAAVLSIPRITAKQRGSSVKITVPELNWSARRCRAESGNKSCQVWHSLALPLLLHDFGNDREVLLSMENIARFAAFDNAQGKTVIKGFSSGSPLYDSRRDGEMGGPHLLLYRTDRARPLLLVFSGKVEKIVPVVRDGEAVMLRISLSGKNNHIAAGFPFGAEAVSCEGGDKALPARWKKMISNMTLFAFNYPVKINEFYKVDRKAGKIDIINSFETLHIANSWGVPEYEYAFMPPLAAFMLQQKKFVTSGEKLTSFDIPTEFGPTLGVAGRNAVMFSYDLPPDDDFQIPRILNAKADALGNTFFADGVKWSCGGRTPAAAWSAAYPNGGRNGKNIDMFSWNFGLNSAMQGVFSLNDSNRKLLDKRMNTRFLEPLEKYGYKVFLRHRREPFSGTVYPVLIQLYHSLYTPFAPGTGSKITFGDANEAHTVFMWMVQQLEDLAGQQGLAAANWNLIKYAARYELCIDDYAFQSGSCRDFGTGSWIDMLNSEYAGMMALARNAELAGDFEYANMALYRASRRAVPTLARMFFREYYNKLYPEKAKDNMQITGFGEGGAKYMMYPANNFNFMAAMDLFDFSEGFPGTLIRLYDKYARKEICGHVSKRVLPSLEAELKKGNTNYAWLPPLALYLEDDRAFERIASNTMRLNRRMGDWPGMRRSFEIDSAMWRKYGKVTFRKFRALNISRAVYDPASRTLEVDYTSGANSLLTVESPMSAASVSDNSKAVKADIRGKELYLPVSKGKHRVKVQFK